MNIHCPKCQTVLSIAPEHAGMVLACPKCQQHIRAPGQPPAAQPQPVPQQPVPQQPVPQHPPQPPTPPQRTVPAGPASDFDFGEPEQPSRRRQNEAAQQRPGHSDDSRHTGSGGIFEEVGFEDKPRSSARSCPEIPPHVAHEVQQLGQPQQYVQIGANEVWTILIVISVILGVVLLVVGSYVLVSEGWRDTTIGLVGLMFVPWILLGFFIVGRLFLDPPVHLWACEHGIIWSCQDKGGAFFWDEVGDFRKRTTAVFLATHGQVADKPYQIQFEFIFSEPNGKVFKLASELSTYDMKESKKGVKDFGEYVEEQTSAAVLPIFREQLQQGEKLQFRSFCLDREAVYAKRPGVGKNSKELELDAVDEVILEQGHVIVVDEDGYEWAKVATIEVAYLGVFMALTNEAAEDALDRRRQQRRERPRPPRRRR